MAPTRTQAIRALATAAILAGVQDPLAELILAKRDAREDLTPNPTQQVTLIVAACYIVVIGILPYLEKAIYPFKLLTVGLHEMCHALAGVITCAHIESITLEPNEGGTTRMRGGIPSVRSFENQLTQITLPAGYLGSGLIGAIFIACGFDTNASKVSALVLAFFLLLTLFWARRSWVPYLTFAFVAALLIVCWLVARSVALRFLILFIGVMSCFYTIWDIVDDTLARKVNSSDASEYANLIGCCSSRFWGAFWLLQSILFFGAGLMVGLAVFKDDFETQAQKADNFLGGSPG
ncbi:peptidase M50B-like-domain-containing protein [Dioszegia hungarica]|uniref:Peptidase M50B-like-domain-containing protein n=1 Tax=Dioszegia hungarica TaxID=4972 RepID=A0AA38H4J7_9TREE|nr:peptidase M50B-like-domain-containing protein [Dioszegia hungarica]KAI9632454.1 peptidase M50B-like-domain-containing protein [Dioszegia hungarica]